MTPDCFLYLCTAKNEDERQDQYLALLEAKPATEQEAVTILRKLHHRTEWLKRQEKFRYMPLLGEEATPDMSNGNMIHYLNELDEDAAAIIRLRVFQDQSFDEIADLYGYSQETARRRYYAAIKRLLACVKLTSRTP